MLITGFLIWVLTYQISSNGFFSIFSWMLTSGQLLASREAIFPTWQAIGLEDEEIRRIWTAFGAGSWQISDLLTDWQIYVEAEGPWQEHSYEGYRPIGVDITAFWRPTL